MVTLTKCSSEIDNVASAINTAISLVPPILRGMLEDVYAKWNEFLARAREFFDRVAEVTSYGLGDPGALRTAADNWKHAAAGVLDDAAKLVSSGKLRAVDSWEGPAAEAYAHAIEDHADAVEELKSSVKTMSRALTDHAQSIDDFWSNIGNGFVNFLLSLAGVAVSIVGLIPPFTVAGIIGLVLSIISCVKSIYDLFSTEISDLERFAEVAKRLGEDVTEQFSESWPKLTAGNGVRV